ncbi:uncharacterized protein LOC112095674 [Citrus clementina]|uniref:uncharacterized protein LOC112095674 n=1 Tax=Citrus clementina TaxID=85681 RepID=UPI000CED0F31|nr:uncharacterized protein LOC112095674 [Citrus x clementina]
MKSTHWNFPDSLLQQYNFDTNTTEAPAEVSKEATDMDEPEEEAVVNPQAEANSEAAEQSDQHEEEGDKLTHRNFPDSLLQQYNFDTNTIEAPAKVSKEATDMDEPEEEAAVNPQAEANSEAAEQSDQHEEEGDNSATDSSPTEAEEESEKELISRKGKEKIATPPASEDEAEQVDVELEAAATKVTRTPTEAKQLLDIIATITAEGHATNAPAPAPSQQTLNKHVCVSPRGFTKRKGGTSGGIAAAASPKPKRTRYVSTKQVAPMATPPTSPL